MKKILTFLLLLIGLVGVAQDSVKYTYSLKTPTRFDKVQFDSVATLPADTLAKAKTGSVAFLYPCFYVKTPVKWVSFWCEPIALAITSQPTGAEVTVNMPVTFTVAAGGGTPPYTYQWRKDGGNILGANSHTYTIASAQESNEGGYSVFVTDFDSATALSNEALLTVLSPDFDFSVQPVAKTVYEGQSLTMSATVVSGVPPYTFAWHHGSIINTDYPIVNATQGITLSASVTEDWYVVVKDGADETITSDTVTVTVLPGIQYGRSSTDPYIDNSTIPTISSPRALAYTPSSNISVPFTSADADNYLIVRVPASESIKTEWYNTTLNQGSIPDITWRAPFTIGAYTYYVSREPVVIDVSQPIILKRP